MKAFTVHRGTVAPLRRTNVDTDQIIPAVYLKRVTRTGFEDGLFAAWRANEADFVLNKPEYARSSILVADNDFGTGSSREHAVWALMDYGFRVVIAPRFGDIFRNNALKTGLLVIEQPIAEIEKLWEHAESQPEQPVEIDLVANEIRYGNIVTAFVVDPYARWRLLEGLDDIALTERHLELITEFESARPERLPTIS
ncbi:MAG: 3-isopropylmalate dehydratase small subunit [Actinomycetota bacterium]|jgi:3-isopropylmalate/(R)-2-methylmalate dehydratase small subunit|nr:3-isopropylmalate dehydratase small subunit [Actinomycetota bacterium]